jgi:putative heme-binding domain-containing protein
MEYALSLRNLKSGWTLDQRKDYFAWFLKAANYRGGHSFLGFVKNIKSEAVEALSAADKAELKSIIEAVPKIVDPFAGAKPRSFVKNWKTDELVALVDKGLSGRNFDRGRQLFGETKCYACHRFNNEGGNFGPDLTVLSGRFAPRDVIDKVINPSKYISDQYAGVTIVTLDDKIVTGRIINLAGDSYKVNTNMLDPDGLVNVSAKNIATIGPSKTSMMPTGLLDVLHEDEVLDLVAYLLSRGERGHKMFKR